MRPILVAQLSGPHLRAGGIPTYGRVDTAICLARAVAHLAAMDPPPDAVAVSGDLGDKGEPGEYALFRDLVARCECRYT